MRSGSIPAIPANSANSANSASHSADVDLAYDPDWNLFADGQAWKRGTLTVG